ncbi:hypothetical protein [Bacillus pinisoli]|uniref:hypothetical protein n=1 Tax=Bacillus pinisoli TaxID=2901866 RepID=UPI001FF2735A|nr:hypothetical protein [Bacillus pinisoli]
MKLLMNMLFPLLYSHILLHLFAVVEDGVLHGNRFVPWRQIQSFVFVPIYTLHMYYGYSQEVNDRYELILKKRLFTLSCIVASEEMKERLTQALSEQGIAKEEVVQTN